MSDHPDPDGPTGPMSPEPTVPDDLGDELASAYLDGVATVDERVTVEASPELLLRVDAFRGLRSDLAALPAPDAAPGREHAIEAALAAARAPQVEPPVIAGTTAADDVTGPANVVPLRRRWARWAGPVAAAAALLVVALIATRSLGSDGEDGSDTASGAAESTLASTEEGEAETMMRATDDAGEDRDESAASAEAGDATASAPVSTTTMPAPAPTVPAGGGTADPQADPALPCRDELLAANPELGDLARSIDQGEAVVYVFELSSGTLEAYEVDVAACTLGRPVAVPG